MTGSQRTADQVLGQKMTTTRICCYKSIYTATMNTTAPVTDTGRPRPPLIPIASILPCAASRTHPFHVSGMTSS